MKKIVFIACTNVGRAMIEEITYNKEKYGVQIAGVVNLRPDCATNKANYDSYSDLVKKYGINVYYCENVNEPSCVEFLKALTPDIIIQSGWSQKFGREILNIPKYACIGEHPAPLPKGRGAACVNWAIINGETEWGDTFFKMEEQYDTGVIYSQKFFKIEMYDDVKTVYDKVAAAAVETIRENLKDWMSGKLCGRPQNDLNATRYSHRSPEDGEFDFSQSAMEIYNQVRAQTRPYFGAFFYKGNGIEKKKVYVWKASLSISDGGREFTCGDGKKIYLIRVQEENSTEKWAKDYFGDW